MAAAAKRKIKKKIEKKNYAFKVKNMFEIYLCGMRTSSFEC